MSLYYVSPHRLARRIAALSESQRPDVHIPVDVTADEEGFTLIALVPGLAPDQVSIEVLEETITLRGEFQAPETGEGVRVLLSERPTGRFSRTLRLPASLDAARAEADVKQGVLTVRVPKAESAKAKQIKVKAK
ncbi:MAG: Hsp20/alpha crystallin family protein [Anaerolineae bacterium]|nr:MAG: Hsp20/alpha crystallin family protein [Anaerolineae bacterium]